jgi:diadenosine tetraphosphate (Ap4A) HIT family hydrolase
LHWHIIARFADDHHFPESIWGYERRRGPAHDAPDPAALAARIAVELARISDT